MDAYPDRQAQQIDQARTFAEIRQIEERAGKVARPRPDPRRRAAWPFGVLTARRRRAVAGSRG
jgi:hypothetical protein